MGRNITLTINGETYIAIPASEYHRIYKNADEQTPAHGLAGTDAVAYAHQSMGNDLKKVRLAVRLTQQQLATAMKVTQANIANIEAGRTRIGEALVKRWMKACGKPVNWKPE